jgi:hypothetical protein
MSEDHREDHQTGRHHFFRDRGWIGGLIVIAIGVVLLLENFGVTVPQNGWALFLFIPAAFAYANALQAYRRDGGLTTASIGSFVGGTVLVVLAVVFLLELTINWDLIGPIALILIGLGVLARHYRQR